MANVRRSRQHALLGARARGRCPPNMAPRDSQKSNYSTSHRNDGGEERKKRAQQRLSRLVIINITSRYISSTITTSLGVRLFSRALHEKCGNIALRRAAAAAAAQPSLALKLLPLVNAAAAVASGRMHSSSSKCVLCVQRRQRSRKETKNEGGRLRGASDPGDNCVD